MHYVDATENARNHKKRKNNIQHFVLLSKTSVYPYETTALVNRFFLEHQNDDDMTYINSTSTLYLEISAPTQVGCVNRIITDVKFLN